MEKQKVYLTLQNGKVFEGYRFGADNDVVGELVFTTGMVGYLETLTEPANLGQIFVQTFPLIGNYGVMHSDLESDKIQVKALVVREICETPSNFRCEESLDSFMKAEGVVGVYGVDTRELTKIIRDNGTMNATITSKPLKSKEQLNAYKIENAVQEVTPKDVQVFESEQSKYTVALWNFGAKRSTVNQLLSYGCKVISIPATYTAEQILALSPDGVMLSDGPGNPADNTGIINELQKIVGKKPVFGVGLGHQMFAIALGATTKKMKYGHRGGQPVKYTETGRVYISSQNHGYVVDSSSVQKGKVNFINANDYTCEGIDYTEHNAFTVQFNPESCSAACEPNILYEKFVKAMEEKKNA